MQHSGVITKGQKWLNVVMEIHLETNSENIYRSFVSPPPCFSLSISLNLHSLPFPLHHLPLFLHFSPFLTHCLSQSFSQWAVSTKKVVHFWICCFFEVQPSLLLYYAIYHSSPLFSLSSAYLISYLLVYPPPLPPCSTSLLTKLCVLVLCNFSSLSILTFVIPSVVSSSSLIQ